MSFLRQKPSRNYHPWTKYSMTALPRRSLPDPSVGEGTSGYTCHPGSLTVEASVVFPLFLLTLYLFWCLFTACLIHIRVQHAMDEVSAALAQQSYLIETLSEGAGDADTSDGSLSFSAGAACLAWRVLARTQIVHRVGRSALNASPVQSGSRGLSLAASTWDRRGDICLIVRYRLAFPTPFGRLLRLKVEQVSRRKCWTGTQPAAGADDEEAAGTEEMVYVTSKGRVYHRDIQCYHLNVTVRRISAASVGAARNRDGGRYRPCEHCAVSAGASGTVYITPEGDRYHTTRDCSGLKRTVRTVPLSQTGLPACSHCG